MVSSKNNEYFCHDRIPNLYHSPQVADNKYELDEKDFKCNLCPRQFSKQGNLKNHMMGEHNIVGDIDDEEFDS